jgi:hypothetical protein
LQEEAHGLEEGNVMGVLHPPSETEVISRIRIIQFVKTPKT